MIAVNPAFLLNPLSGGLDIFGVVDQILAAAAAPKQSFEAQLDELDEKLSALSTLRTKLDALMASANSLKTDAFDAKSASSSDPTRATATASSLASAATYNLIITSLASSATLVTNAFADANSTTGTGSFTITQGGTSKTVSIDTTNNTLNGIAAAINNLGLKLKANIITDSSGARLSIISSETGAANDITISGNTIPNVTFNKTSAGADANFTVNGISISSSSNVITGVVQGVTFFLNNTGSATITVANDTGAAKSAINDLADKYNAVVSFINAQFAFDLATNSAGPLSGDATLRQVQSTLQEIVSSSVTSNSQFQTLRSIGLKLNDDGTLVVDSAALDSALGANLTEVKNLFQSSSPQGIAVQLTAKLDKFIAAQTGFIALAEDSLRKSQGDLQEQIEQLDRRLAEQRDLLIRQFSDVNAALMQMSVLQFFLSAQITGARNG